MRALLLSYKGNNFRVATQNQDTNMCFTRQYFGFPLRANRPYRLAYPNPYIAH
jgi:hypothetical protein